MHQPGSGQVLCTHAGANRVYAGEKRVLFIPAGGSHAFLSLGLSSLPLFRLKPALGPVLAILLAPLKLLAGSLAFLTAVPGLGWPW